MFDFMSHILDEIRRAIKASDKSRYRLSKETSIPESQLSRLMTGEKGLSFEALERLVEALNLEIVIRKKPKRKKV
jgi:hypothetical protein